VAGGPCGGESLRVAGGPCGGESLRVAGGHARGTVPCRTPAARRNLRSPTLD
jgi:hypothetical protein